MSGIGGVRAFSAEASSAGALNAAALRGMAQRLQHRGPDASSHWLGADVGLIHTGSGPADHDRAQPLHSADGRWVVALDGDVSNHESLRARLDHPFRTAGAAEVVVAGLALEGISFVDRLQGQFAFVAHDLRTDTTHLVRDRLGVVPLYYRHVPHGIAFGSEVKAVLAVGPGPEVDLRSLDAYLSSGFVAGPDTLFEGVKKVRPGHRLSIMPRGQLEETQYWWPPERDPDGTWTPGDSIEAVGDGVREAVRTALVSDAPVGAHLSTDLASTIVVARMQQLRDEQRVHTFSVGVDHPGSDELAWTRRVSASMGTEHHEVRLRTADFEDLWSRLTWHRDAPVSDPGDVAMLGLARAAHDHVGVLLSGAGCEEVLGASSHGPAWLPEHASALPPRVRSLIAPARSEACFTPAERSRMLGSLPPHDRCATRTPGADAADRTLRDDLRHWLPDHLLERGDRLSMEASVRWRPALLDHRLVELALRLPASVRIRSGSSSWLLTEVARPLLPREVVQGAHAASRVPWDAWLHRGLRDTAHDWLLDRDSWVGSTLDRSSIGSLLGRHVRGTHHDARLWSLLSLEMWHRSFFGAAPSVPRPREVAAPQPVAHGGRA